LQGLVSVLVPKKKEIASKDGRSRGAKDEAQTLMKKIEEKTQHRMDGGDEPKLASFPLKQATMKEIKQSASGSLAKGGARMSVLEMPNVGDSSELQTVGENDEDTDKESQKPSKPAAHRMSILMSQQAAAALRAKEEKEKALNGLMEVAQLGKGKAFGELALIQNKPRAASIRCLQETHLAVMSRNDYDKVVKKLDAAKLKEIVDFLKNMPQF
jgi:hypothetical protein